MATRQEITDEQWAVLAPLFPSPKGRGRPPMDMRTTVEGIAWRFRTGAPWRDMPDRFGKWNSIYQRFSDWSADGTWARLLATVQGAAAAQGRVQWTVPVDSTITRVHQHGATLARDTGGLDRVTRIRVIGSAISSRLTTRLAAPAAVSPARSISRPTARAGHWGWCSPGETPPTPRSSPRCSTPSASAMDVRAARAPDPTGCWPTRPTPPRPTAATSATAASRSPSPNARTRKPAVPDAAQPVVAPAASTPRPTRAAT